MGFEPIYILRDRQATTPSSLTSHCLVASTGNDPVSNGYQPFALPLSYEAVFGAGYTDSNCIRRKGFTPVNSIMPDPALNWYSVRVSIPFSHLERVVS